PSPDSPGVARCRGNRLAGSDVTSQDPHNLPVQHGIPLLVPRALLVDDEPSHLEAMQALVARQGFDTRTASSLEGARRALEEENFDLLITDLQLPDGTSLDLLPLMEQRPAMDLVLVTGHASVDTAVRAMRGGATDYLTKPIDVRRLEKGLAHVQRAARRGGRGGGA